ncbi:MAG: HAMP domain-containing histidine kinase [Bacteroidetes bacterium]|nr:HAMP domain-containing histidine kinase [Bacteroidota bacterium]
MVKYFYSGAASVLLLLIAIFFSLSEGKNYTGEVLAEKIAGNLQRDFQVISKEGNLLLYDSVAHPWSLANHNFFLISESAILKWSRNDLALDFWQLQGTDSLQLVQTSRADALVYKKKAGERRWLVCIIPLKKKYEITNRYLNSSWNEEIFPVKDVEIKAPTDGKGICIDVRSNCIFKIVAPDHPSIENRPALVLTLLAVVIFLVTLGGVLMHLHNLRRYWLVFGLMFTCLAGLRILMVQFSFPARWISSAYFDSRFFASSSFNSSLGDLFFNTLIVTVSCAYLFLFYQRSDFVKNSLRLQPRQKVILVITLLTASFFSFLFPYLYVESVFHDSAIPFDITATVYFTGLRAMAYAALLLGTLSSFFFLTVFVRWVKALVSGSLQFMLCLLAAAILFVTYFILSDLDYWVTLIVGATCIVLLYFASFLFSVTTTHYRSFLFLLMAVIMYSTQSALGVKHFAEEKKIKAMSRWAENLNSHDVLAEYLLNESAAKISEDPFIAASLSNPLLTKHGVRQKIRQQHLNSYLNRYEVKVDLFTMDGSPADRETNVNFATTIRQFENDANKTTFANVYLINGSLTDAVKRYFVVVPVMRHKSTSGYALLTLSLKKVIPHQVYPELLVDGRFTQAQGARDFSYGFFEKDTIVNSFGNFNFEKDFDRNLLGDSRLYREGINWEGNWLVGNEDDAGRRAVVVAPSYSTLGMVANFSFLFVQGAMLIFVFLVFRWISSPRSFINYSTRIQVYFYAAFILPLIAVSVLSLRLIGQSNELQLEREIQDKGSLITEDVSALQHSFPDSSNYVSGFQQRLAEIAQSNSTEANVYSLSGELMASSQPAIFKNGLIMPLADRRAWEKIVLEQFNNYKAPCRIGSLEYYSSFFPIKSSRNGKLIGLLELPFFESSSDNARIIALSNILVTFAVVFIFFSILTVGATHSLTNPLRFIAKKLKTTSLQNNQPIEWKSDDEIGLMVSQYNSMLDTLEKNRADLVKIQKEQAWREIAQQVAHEIKNPLTPMKLTLQHMEQSMGETEISKDRLKKSLQTMLDQVEILNGIASSFSAFASMPEPELTRVDLNSLLNNVTSLFQNHPEGKVRFIRPAEMMFIRSDEKLLTRIFSNLIINGLQAGKDGRSEVDLAVESSQTEYTVSITDKGMGIASEIQARIFLPHFSTKKTGSGLGLAISKQGLERMGATIAFTTRPGSGTTFYVRFKKD